MNTKVLTSINDIPAEQWNSIVGRNRLICRHEYLRAVEASQINDCRFFYPVVYDGKDIVAHACLYFISTELDALAKGGGRAAVGCVRKLWKQFLVLRTIECGSPVSLGSAISFRDGVDHVSALQSIVREAECLARQMKCNTVLFRDFYDSDVASYDSLSNQGYSRLQNLPCTRLRVRWDSFEDYLAAMRSRYRWKLVAQLKKCRNTLRL